MPHNSNGTGASFVPKSNPISGIRHEALSLVVVTYRQRDLATAGIQRETICPTEESLHQIAPAGVGSTTTASIAPSTLPEKKERLNQCSHMHPLTFTVGVCTGMYIYSYILF